jgi:hypothetical protein
MKKTKQPVVPAINRKSALALQDTQNHQKLLELKQRSEIVELQRQRLASRKGRPAEDFFDHFFAKHNIAYDD